MNQWSRRARPNLAGLFREAMTAFLFQGSLADVYFCGSEHLKAIILFLKFTGLLSSGKEEARLRKMARFSPDLLVVPKMRDGRLSEDHTFWLEVKPCKNGILDHSESITDIAAKHKEWCKKWFFLQWPVHIMLVEESWSRESMSAPVFYVVQRSSIERLLQSNGTSGMENGVAFFRETLNVDLDDQIIDDVENWVKFYRIEEGKWAWQDNLVVPQPKKERVVKSSETNQLSLF